jgi:pimeloyl-ACP methyl ester carboxylesterase
VTERELVVAGIRSPLIEAGPGDAAEAVLFVHGNPGSSGDWRDLVGRVGEFGRAVALDFPGFGRADKPEDFDYSVPGYARHIEEARKALGVDRVHLVLHDIGGQWGLVWAVQHPEAVASVVLINIGVVVRERWYFLARVLRTPVLGELVEWSVTKPVFKRMLRRGNPRGLPAEFVEEMWSNYDHRTRRAILRLYRATPPGLLVQYADTFRELDPPTLVIWGAHDPYVPVEHAERQRQYFPHADVHILADSGHWPYADNPERVAALVVPFLGEQLAAARA